MDSSATASHTAFRKYRSWEISSTVPRYFFSASSSQAVAFKSRWFVGSSSMSSSGWDRSVRARHSRVFSPPDSEAAFWSCRSLEKPSPASTPWMRLGHS